MLHIDRLKWCHSNLWSRYDLHVVGHGVLWEVNWWRFVTLFKYNRIIRFKKSLLLSLDGDLTKFCKMFTFPCPTTWRPVQLEKIKLLKVRYCQLTYTVTHGWHKTDIYPFFNFRVSCTHPFSNQDQTWHERLRPWFIVPCQISPWSVNTVATVLFFSRPRSKGWPHQRFHLSFHREFCPGIDVVHQAVHGLPRLRAPDIPCIISIQATF